MRAEAAGNRDRGREHGVVEIAAGRRNQNRLDHLSVDPPLSAAGAASATRLPQTGHGATR